MPLKFDTTVVVYLGVIILLLIIISIIKSKNNPIALIIKGGFKIIIGGIVICSINWLMNILGVKISFPLNPATAAMVGFLNVPGFILMVMIKYLIFPL
ncbi:hypothetical protein Q428_10030 [Fervidicella metallireducens AeB]|uniref:SigmaK-factor processing regulatory BofA n=1 Tax=Fervidicella metallireducens AeB TaxID=1403537 RepID=A0A017RTV0_9CLOT|nr:pro-sigmaK processing inhibitor BofA family protein [Fervidicella metallireducens]EYE88072.1 hypothetical protein Q428_10030 [Fervidicella metallireducens AeB]